MKTNIQIRSESPMDYHRISEIYVLAFDESYYMGEPVLLGALRHRSSYDPELALVAEINGEIVGHILLSPFQMRLEGKEINAVALSPIAVDPEFQKQGIGSKLIEEGLQRASNKGFSFSFLLGHSSYYPKFGYVTNMYGTSKITLDRNDIELIESDIKEQRVTKNDIPQLVSMWEEWFGGVDLAIFPGNSIIGWLSVNKKIRSSVIFNHNEIIGYIRYDCEKPENIYYFLSKDSESTRQILSYINKMINDNKVNSISLPIHPKSPTTKKMIANRYQEELNTWNVAMIKILNGQNKLIVKYHDDILSGKRPPGMLIWPVEFDVFI